MQNASNGIMILDGVVIFIIKNYLINLKFGKKL
jgi:hypothetical protein